MRNLPLGFKFTKRAFTYDVRCFLGIFDLPTYPDQILYYINLFSKIRCSLTYLPTQNSDVICECSLSEWPRYIRCYLNLFHTKYIHVCTSTDNYNNQIIFLLLWHPDFDNVDNDVKDAKFLLKRFWQFKICLKC